MPELLRNLFTNKHEIMDFKIKYSVIVDKKGSGTVLEMLENSQYKTVIGGTEYKPAFPQSRIPPVPSLNSVMTSSLDVTSKATTLIMA